MQTLFQSTLPHGERLARGGDGPCPDWVSIHAPARGATRRIRSAPYRPSSFNPRSRTGSDYKGNGVSIARAAFQSTLPHGERHCASTLSLCQKERFNPRSRTGSDAHPLVLPWQAESFNPRSRTGSDFQRGRYQDCGQGVSIHAPARGATLRPVRHSINSKSFNPRSRTGSDSPLHPRWSGA